MAFEEERQFTSSLMHIKGACKVLYYITRACYVVALVMMALAVIGCCVSLVAPDVIPFLGSVDIFTTFLLIVYGGITILIIRMVMLILKEVLENESPFTLKQAKRVKNIALLLFAKVVADLVFPGDVIPLVDNAHVSLSYEVIKSETLILNVNVEFLALAVILFVISLVFQYGVLLQSESKDFF